MIKQTAFAVAAIAAGVSAQAEEANALSVTADISYVSDYVFRGVKYADDSIQPSIEASYAGAYAGVWHTDDVNNAVGSETDLYAGYSFSLNDKLTLDAGLTRYTYTGGSVGDTTEAFVKLSADVLLSPTVAFYHDFDIESSVVELSVGYSLAVDAINSSLDFSAVLGNASNALVLGNEDYTYGSVGVAVPYKLSETATLTVGLDYVVSDSPTVAGFSALGQGNDIVVGKAGLSIGF